MMLAGTQCCCDAVGCVIDDDGFEDASIGAQWTTVSGSWAESGGSLSTSSAGAQIRNTTAHPDNEEEMYLSVSQTVTSGTSFDVIVNRLDDNNFHFARFTLSTIAATVAVYIRSGGSNTLLSSASSSIFHDFTSKTVTVCMASNGITASVSGGVGDTIIAASLSTPHTGGIYFALGLDAGTVNYTNASFEKHGDLHEGCNVCGALCEDCCDPAVPPFPFYRVDLGAGGWTDARCAQCNELLGEYIVDYLSACHWRYTDTNYCALDISVCNLCGTTADLQIDLELIGSAPSCSWRVTVTLTPSPIDPSCGAPCTTLTRVVYDSGTLADDQQCQTLPVTLNKTTEFGITGGVLSICGGTMPASITLEAA